MGSNITIGVLSVNVQTITWGTTGSSQKIAATEIDPYTIVLGYEPEKVTITGNVKSTGIAAIRNMNLNEIYTVTAALSEFPEFKGTSTRWYLTGVTETQVSGYGSERVDCKIDLVKNYGES